MCPGGVPTGYTYFIPQEEMLESRVVTRGYMESRMVVSLAGRCALRRPGSVQSYRRQAPKMAAYLIARQCRDICACGESARTPAHGEHSPRVSSCLICAKVKLPDTAPGFQVLDPCLNSI